MPPSSAIRLALFYGAIFIIVGIQLPFWPLWLKWRGMTAEEIGFILACASGIRALTNPLIAHFADRRGERKRPIILLTWATFATFALFSVTHGVWGLVAVSLLLGIVSSASFPMIETLAIQTSAEHKFDYGRVRLWGSVTFIIAALLGGRLLIGTPEPIILWLILGGCALTVMAAHGLPDTRSPPAERHHIPVVRILSDRSFVVFFCASAMLTASHAVYYAFASLHWRSHGIGADLIGWLWAEGVIAEIALFAFSGAIVRAVGPGRLIVLSAVAGVIRWTLTAATTDLAALFIVQLLHAFTFAAMHLGAMHFMLRAAPAQFGATVQSLASGLSSGVAMGTAMALSGWLYARLGGGAFLVMAALSAGGLLFALVLLRLWRAAPAGTAR
jgi:PPP family 3-phenylpropionic acid transporter